MIKRVLFSISFSVAAFVMQAQPVKANFFVAQKLEASDNTVTGSNDKEQIALFVKGNIGTIKRITLETGGVFRYAYGNIASVKVTVAGIKMLLANPAVERLEGGSHPMRAMNDSMRVNNSVVQVQTGQSPLPQAYDGDGVVVGIIDSGIDFLHPDFRDSINGVSHTRVKYIWDQLNPLGSNTPSYGYGQTWDSTEIENGTTLHSDTARPEETHGTHVAGTAAGNGTAAGINKGVAPKADLVVVGFNFNMPTGFEFVDAVDYIFKMADSLGEPCVINASLGDYIGSHDGKDLQAQMIDAMITAKNGRVLVASAGNSGYNPIHLGYNTSAVDTQFTWFNKKFYPYIYFELWAYAADFKNVKFSVGADRVTPDYKFKGNLPFTDIKTNMGGWIKDTLWDSNGTDRLGRVWYYKDSVDGSYALAGVIFPDSTAFNWRFMTKGAGKFDLWSYNMIGSGLPTTSVMPAIAHYQAPDSSQSMVTSFQCSDKVITVGNYTNRNSLQCFVDTLFVDPTSVPQRIAPASSWGPTRDGRIKPDITASGDFQVSCIVISKSSFMSGAVAYGVAKGGKHIIGGGTSSSSPVVAGVAALYLQRYPNSSWLDVKTALINCTKTDVFTGNNLPNNRWGYGKVNAFKALQNCALTVPEIEERTGVTKIYPNPSSTFTLIRYDLYSYPGFKNATLKVYDMIGNLIDVIPLRDKSGSVVLKEDSYSSGIYLCSMVVDGRVVSTNRLVISK